MKANHWICVGIFLCCCTCFCSADEPPPFQPWAGAAISDWQNASEPIVLTDMAEASPADAFSSELAIGRWKVIPYEMTNGYRGQMIWAGPETQSPPVSLPLRASGWYAIFVGLFSAPEVPTTVWLKLDSDPASVPRCNASDIYRGNSEEVFFKAACLNPESRLIIHPVRHGFLSSCGVTHVTLIPLSEKEIDRIKTDQTRQEHRSMAATFDGYSYFYKHSPRTKEELLFAIEIFRGTDFKTLILQSPGADKVIYPSTIGHRKGAGATAFPRVGDRYFHEFVTAFETQHLNPEKVLIDGAHALGMNVHVGIRPAGWTYFEPFCDFWDPPFYRDHPQWRCEDRDGTPVARMSWAVPQVRQHLIRLLRERVSFGADGVHIVFNRGVPVMLYEEPARNIFERQHGIDPRTLDEADPRILAWRSDTVLTFMQELRDMLDKYQRDSSSGNRLSISVMIFGNEPDNIQYGIDLGRLVQNGLTDEVFAYKWDIGAIQKTYDIDYFVKSCRSKSVPFSLSTAAYFLKPYYSLEQTCSQLREGATRVCIWDASVEDIYSWSIISHYGHVEDTLARQTCIDIEKPPRTYRRFHRLGEQIRDGRYGPYWGG